MFQAATPLAPVSSLYMAQYESASGRRSSLKLSLLYLLPSGHTHCLAFRYFVRSVMVYKYILHSTSVSCQVMCQHGHGFYHQQGNWYKLICCSLPVKDI